MLRKVTRWVFGLNAAYQGVVGLLALLAPVFTIALYGGGPAEQASPYLAALFRMIGSLLIFVACISAVVAKDPDASPLLVAFMGFLSALGLATWGLALGAGDVTWSQVSLDVLVQIPVLVASVLYYPKAKQRTLDTIELLATGAFREEVLKAAGLAPKALGEGPARELKVKAGERVELERESMRMRRSR